MKGMEHAGVGAKINCAFWKNGKGNGKRHKGSLLGSLDRNPHLWKILVKWCQQARAKSRKQGLRPRWHARHFA
jgi:hypothetical protein